MIDLSHSLWIVATVAGVTAALRFLPFVLFPKDRPVPALLQRLCAVLPCAVMGMLVVYCLKGVSLTGWPFGLPELLAICAVVGLHLYKRNTLLSILGGTLFYMLLLQFVFNF